jgi:glycosyltransferase involved in cell wall biosynthesis
MKIAIYTLTRERLDYTKYCFQTLKEKAGYGYDHFIIDNGSQDGTIEWLKENETSFKNIIYNSENLGISIGSNQALDAIGKDYDLIIKFDNDCEVISEDILKNIVDIYTDIGLLEKFMLSPKVEGIGNVIPRFRNAIVGGHKIGFTHMVGGLFHILPDWLYQLYRYKEFLPKASLQDGSICHWMQSEGVHIGYIESLVVNHYETTCGQQNRYIDYFLRKEIEEKEIKNVE